jgi:hypothetical protein
MLGSLALTACGAYRAADLAYQRAHDPIRRAHADSIVALITAYAARADGRVPFQDRTAEQPFMVVIGRSMAHEDQMAQVPALNKGARWSNSSDLEAELSRVLQRPVVLPRDPQRVATYAPNVYIYFVTGNAFCAVVHLFEPSAISQPYEWDGGRFHSHAVCLEKD